MNCVKVSDLEAKDFRLKRSKSLAFVIKFKFIAVEEKVFLCCNHRSGVESPRRIITCFYGFYFVDLAYE